MASFADTAFDEQAFSTDAFDIGGGISVPILDPCSTLATALKTLLASDSIISAYNWQEWESDADVQQPRGYVNVTMSAALQRADYPDQFNVEIVFEGKPKKGSPSDAVAEVVGQVRRPDFGAALEALITDGSISLFGRTESLGYRQEIKGDLRKRTISFVIFGQWQVEYTA
jgi:hypothetical protein